jgi:hypothetical protein
MVATRPGSAARTTGGGGGSILDRRRDPFRRRGDDGEVIAGDSGDQMGRQMGEAAARQLGWGGDSASDGVGAWATRVKTRGPGEVAAEGGGRREGGAGPR